MHVRKKKAFIPLFCLLILAALFLNWGGDQMVSRWNWPVWLDSMGTMLVAYLLGPWCAAIVGATTNLLGHVLYGIPWWYGFISILIGINDTWHEKSRRNGSRIAEAWLGEL